MKVIDYLFFGVFNSYYKDGNYRNDIPWFTAMMIFSMTFFFNVSYILFLGDSGNGFPVSKPFAIVIGAGCILLSYLLFAWRKRYEKIYITFSKYDKNKRLMNKIIAWFYIIFSITLFVIPPLT